MLPSTRRAASALVLIFGVALAPGRARAAGPESETWARQLFAKGQAFANESQWDAACPFFQAAHALSATGGTALRGADCYEKIGAYGRALEMYQWVVDHRASDKVPERVALAEGRVAALKKQLAPEPPSPAAAAPPPRTGPTRTPAPPPPPASRAPAIAAFAVGGAGAVVAGVFGGLALSQASRIKSDAAQSCSTGSCNDPDLAARKSAASTKAWVANAGVGVAVVGAVVGTILLVRSASPRTEKSSQALLDPLGPDGLAIRF